MKNRGLFLEIDLPIASIFRTKYGEYPEYHTSLDNFDLVSIKGLTGGFNVTRTAINLLLDMVIPKTSILCEPHMSKRKLYPSLSTKNTNKMVRNYMNFIQYADGKNDLDQISQFINLKLKEVKKIYKLLKRKKVIE